MDRWRRRSRTAICSLCSQLARPILDDLCSISTCYHVFHYHCLVQRFVNLPPKSKLCCPACMKEFKSFRCLKRLLFQSPGGFDGAASSDEDESEGGLAEQVVRLKEKLSDKEASLKQRDDELCVWRERARRVEAEKDVFWEEKQHAEQFSQTKLEELSRKVSECSKLQERVSQMAEEAAVLKMNADLDLREEEMTKIESIIAQRMSHDDLVYVLKKSLALRNQQLKEIKFQSDLIAKEAKHTLKKFVKAQEKIERLEASLEEVEKTAPVTLMVRKASKKSALLFCDNKADNKEGNQEVLGALTHEAEVPSAVRKRRRIDFMWS